MPEYVYALHDFLPENEDELSFKAGERIEVIEKDDLYQDGWWQVSSSPKYLFCVNCYGFEPMSSLVHVSHR